MPRILVIDDDPKLNELLSDYLKDFGFSVQSALLPSEGKKLLADWRPDALVIDIMMPEQNGLDLCREIRAMDSPLARLPIIMLTARGDVSDRITGLEIGADDYLPKPFNPRELIARLRALLRRESSNQTEGGGDRQPGLLLDARRQRVRVGGQWTSLHYNEIRLLELLGDKAPGLVDRETIAQMLYRRELGIDDRSIDVMVSRLRRKLGDDPREPRFLASVRNRGYRLVCDFARLEQEKQ